eukprot:869467-Pelagomonas_calceolata.AAC.1
MRRSCATTGIGWTRWMTNSGRAGQRTRRREMRRCLGERKFRECRPKGKMKRAAQVPVGKGTPVPAKLQGEERCTGAFRERITGPFVGSSSEVGPCVKMIEFLSAMMQKKTLKTWFACGPRNFSITHMAFWLALSSLFSL